MHAFDERCPNDIPRPLQQQSQPMCTNQDEQIHRMRSSPLISYRAKSGSTHRRAARRAGIVSIARISATGPVMP